MEVHRFFPGKAFISTILDMLEYKHEMTRETKQRFLMRAAMAGIIIGMFYIGNYAIQAGFDLIKVGEGSLLPIGALMGAGFFGFALVFIYFSKSELLTSNMMITSIGYYYKRATVGSMMRVLGLCYLGNFVGGLFVALLAWKSTIISNGAMELMHHSVDAKTAYITDGAGGWWDLLVRAILCNFFINLAMLMVYNGLIHEDFMKSVAMIVSVFVFAYLGFEHSVANTVLFSIVGLQEGFGAGGLPFGPALANVVVCLVGNFIGGGILIGLYYAYLNDEARFLRKRQDLAGEQKP